VNEIFSGINHIPVVLVKFRLFDKHSWFILGMLVTNRRGFRSSIGHPKTCGSNFIHHNFVQFRKQHSRF